MNEHMTITVTAYGKTVTISQPDDIDMHAFLDTCKNLALSIGYYEDSWKDAVIEMANDYLDEEEAEVNRHLDGVLGQYKSADTTPRYDITSWGPLDGNIS